MWGNIIRRTVIISVCWLWFGVSKPAIWGQQSAQTIKDHQVIAQVGDNKITVQDLEQITKYYFEDSIPSREEKRQQLQNLVVTKLFTSAARSAKLDATEDFPKTKEKARQDTLIHAYFVRYVKPKFSDEEARKYFEAHKEEFYYDFSYSRTKIRTLLEDQALTEIYQLLVKQWEVTQRDDLLRDLDLSRDGDSSLVLARVGPHVVTLGELKERAQLREDISAFATKKFLLETLVLERLYALAAEKEGLADDPVVRKAIEYSEEQLLASRYRRSIEGKVTLKEAQQYYQAHPAEFKWPNQLRVRQLIVATEQAARAAKARLDRGESFEAVAKLTSVADGNTPKESQIVWVRKGTLPADVESVVFQLKPKEISQPIKTPGGYYIVQVDERVEGTVKPFDQVSANLLHELRARAVEAERERLMKVYKVTINKELF